MSIIMCELLLMGAPRRRRKVTPLPPAAILCEKWTWLDTRAHVCHRTSSVTCHLMRKTRFMQS